MKNIIGRKVGMTSVFTADGRYVPVTVIQAGPCTVVQRKTKDTDGYEAVALAFGDVKKSRVTRAMAGHFKRANLEAKHDIREFRDHIDGVEQGQTITADAFAEDYEATDVSVVGGREVRVWTKLEPTGTGSGQSRHYPATDQTVPVRTGARLISGGWGHEHCGLCNEHIDALMVGYCDSDEHWMCDKCHERYVARGDLSFVDEL